MEALYLRYAQATPVHTIVTFYNGVSDVSGIMRVVKQLKLKLKKQIFKKRRFLYRIIHI